MTKIIIPGINAWGETQLTVGKHITQLEKQKLLGSTEACLLVTGSRHAVNTHLCVLWKEWRYSINLANQLSGSF